MNATPTHKFVSATGTTKCAECGKARNTAAHGYSKAARHLAAVPDTPAQEEAPLVTGADRVAAAVAPRPVPVPATAPAPAPAPAAAVDVVPGARAALEAAKAATPAAVEGDGTSTGFRDSLGAALAVGDRIVVAAKGNNVRAKDVGQVGTVTGASRTRVKVTWDATEDAPWKAILPALVTRQD